MAYFIFESCMLFVICLFDFGRVVFVGVGCVFEGIDVGDLLLALIVN